MRMTWRLVAVLLLGLAASGAGAAGEALAPEVVEQVLEFFPEAVHVDELNGQPPAAAVLGPERLLGYALLTDRIAPIPAYSGKPISVLVALGTDGHIRGLRIVHHQEPILGAGVSEAALAAYVEQYRGKDALKRIRMGGRPGPDTEVVDAITGATITSMVINASIGRAVRAVAASRGLPLAAETAREIAAAMGQAEVEEHAAPPGLGAAHAAPPEREPPAWIEHWRRRSGRIAVLVAGLVLLTALLFLQDWVTRYPRALRYLRDAFLLYTVLFIGWYGLAQLSVINVLTFTQALTGEFRWETFLIDPLMFILWSYVAVVLILWGRGVFCGWLCPYGAAQELVNELGRHLRLPQLQVPALLHERLVAIKYVIFVALFGLSLQSMELAIRYAEVEPFKTAISLHFARAWPYVLYAVLLLAVSLVNGKLFCKYLCPLGAALAIGSHFRIFDWLRRRRECGHPCQTCAVECPSQAIRPTGEINPNECHYCLDCQVTFWNAHKCPPLVERRKRFERRGQKLRLSL